jgi:type 1 fimbria pilin
MKPQMKNSVLALALCAVAAGAMYSASANAAEANSVEKVYTVNVEVPTCQVSVEDVKFGDIAQDAIDNGSAYQDGNIRMQCNTTLTPASLVFTRDQTLNQRTDYNFPSRTTNLYYKVTSLEDKWNVSNGETLEDDATQIVPDAFTQGNEEDFKFQVALAKSGTVPAGTFDDLINVTLTY